MEDAAALEQLRGCSVVEGNLRLHGLAGLDLSPLAGLKHVEGELTLFKFNELQALSGLRTVQSLSLEHLAVTGLAPLSRLVSGSDSGAGLFVHQCNSLRDLAGLEGLSLSKLAVLENASLRTLRGASARAEMLDVSIHQNPLLESLWVGSGSSTTSEAAYVRQARVVSLSSNPALFDMGALTLLETARELRLSDMATLPVFRELAEVSILEVQFNRVQPSGADSGHVSIVPALTHIRPGSNSGLLLIDNPGMITFQLPNLMDVTSIWIRDNAELVSVGLPGLTSISDWLIVTCNPQLPETLFDGMQQLVAADRLSLGGNLDSQISCDDI